MMYARLSLALALSSLSIAVYGQTNPPTTANGPLDDADTAIELMTGNTKKFHIEAVTTGSNPNSRTVDLSFEVSTPFQSGIKMIEGISFDIGAPTMFCSSNTDDSDTCLVYPLNPNYPDNGIPYWALGFKRLMLSFTNTNTNSGVEFCEASILEEFCTTRKECESFYKDADTFKSDYEAAIDNSKKNKAQSMTVVDLQKQVFPNGRKTRRYTLSFTVKDVPDTLFGPIQPAGSSNPDMSLGLSNGANLNFGFFVYTGSFVSSACDNDYHKETFKKEPLMETDTRDVGNVQFVYTSPLVSVTAPTPAPTTPEPTKKPTNEPTKKPTKEPTPKPTKKPTPPTTPEPTKKPTNEPTKKPTKEPTPKPTKRPTTPKPTRPPTEPKTKRPTAEPTARPTKVPAPTSAPIELPCPNKDSWNECQLTNSYFKFLQGKNDKKRTQMIKGYCQKIGCYWCGYEDLVGGAYNCRPKIYGERDSPSGRVSASKDQVCTPGTSKMPFTEKGCELFSECPKPEEMTACKALNFEGGYKKDRCEGGFATEYNGKTYTAPKKACAYYNGICRAVGEYFAYRKTLVQISGYFSRIKKCEYSENLPTIPQND